MCTSFAADFVVPFFLHSYISHLDVFNIFKSLITFYLAQVFTSASSASNSSAMLKSLVLLSVLGMSACLPSFEQSSHRLTLTSAIGATAQFEGIDGLTALPKECESQCAAVEAVAPQCVNMDNKCLEAVCAVRVFPARKANFQDTSIYKPCLDCAKMGAMYDTLVQSCQYLSLGGGGASGSASGSAGGSSASPLLPGADADVSVSGSETEPTASGADADVSAAEPTVPAATSPAPGKAGGDADRAAPSAGASPAGVSGGVAGGASASPTGASAGAGAVGSSTKPSASSSSSAAAGASGAASKTENSGAAGLVASAAGIGAAALLAACF